MKISAPRGGNSPYLLDITSYLLPQSKFLLPESVKITVCVDCNRLFICECEDCLGCRAYFKMLAVEPLVTLKSYPKDTVLLCHGMLDRSDGYLDEIALDLCDGDVLFVACLDYAGDELRHLLAAAHHGYAMILNLFYYVAAVLTDIKFNVVFHY